MQKLRKNELTKKTTIIYLEKMKSIRYHIIAGALALMATGCSDDGINAGKNPAKTGDEVQFGLSLPGKGSRTVYGEDTGNSFPIYWVNGDKVRVASPQCLSGRNSAEYQIAVVGETQNYATNMTHTGEYGVQWGNAETADFYSIYPSSASTKLEVSGDNVTTTLHVDATQFASTTDKGTSYYAQPAEMGNVVMYAKTTGVKKAENTTVELQYTPFSTVLEFEINAPSEPVADKQTEITIQSLTLTAPTETTIAGDFGFTFPTGESTTPSIEAATGGSSTITMHFLENNQYKTVLSTTKTTLKAKMCLMPISGVKSLLGWTVAVNTSAGTFSKTIKDSDLTGKNTALAPGQVHKIKLPKLNYASQEWTYNTANWITSLPDYTNIYLSEISLPGAWYAGSSESYQATTDIATLWNAGVRAFAVECRSWTERGGLFVDITNRAPTRIALSGTGSEEEGAYTDQNAWKSSTYISSIISSVAGSIKKDEYGVLVLSYADGGSGGHRALDYQYFLNGIANEITQSGATNIYSGTIDKNTTVNDVLGKLIIKVNVDYNIPIGSYGSDQNYLISYNPFLLQISTDAANFAHPYYSDLHWKSWSDDYKNCAQVNTLTGISDDEAASKFIWVFSSANRTQANTGSDTTIPTYENRQTALKAMMDFSKTVYERSNHNVWFYFNCGGTQATSSTSSNPSPTAFASTMNSWLLETINAKTDPSPLGIVMFNQCTGANATYHGADIIKAIIEMNSKFYLKHAGVSGGTSTGGSGGTSTGGTEANTAQNDATLTSGGNAF